MSQRRGKSAKPETIRLARVSATVVRGPRADDPNVWYWSIRGGRTPAGDRPTFWCGWATAAEVSRRVGALVDDRAVERASRPQARVGCKNVLDVLEYWAAAQRKREDISPTTVKSYISAARILGRAIGLVQLDRLDTHDLAHYRDTVLRAGGASATLQYHFRVLSFALGWAYKLGLWKGPVPHMPRLKVTPKREKATPTPAHAWRTVLEGERLVFEGDPRERRELAFEGRWRDFAIIALGTGARPISIARLRPSDIHVDGDDVVITFRGKIQSQYIFPVRGEAAEVARRLAQADPDVCLWPRSDPNDMRSGFSERFASLDWKALGVRRFTPYGIRRMVEDQMYDGRVDPSVAAKLLDHTPEVAMRKYRRPSMEALERGVALSGAGLQAGPVVLSFEAAAASREAAE